MHYDPTIHLGDIILMGGAIPVIVGAIWWMANLHFKVELMYNYLVPELIRIDDNRGGKR